MAMDYPGLQEISFVGSMDVATTDKAATLIFGRGNFERTDVQVGQESKKVIYRRKREGTQEGRKG